MKVCFLLTHIPDPRMNKRIEVLKECSEVQVICVRRSSQDIWKPSQNVKHEIIDIDLPSAKNLIKRYFKSIEFQRIALQKLNEIQPDVVYAEGLDTLLIANQDSKKRKIQIIFEVADLRESYIVKPRNPIKRLITDMLLAREKQCFRNVNNLVITSPKFYDYHYKTLISRDKTIFIPNAPDIVFFRDYMRKKAGDFTVGFIGGIRYLNQMKMLVDSAKFTGCKVLFAGAGGTSTDYIEIKEYCDRQEHVEFTGKYDYNSQIARLYGRVDCVYAVYDADNPNVRLALPNKLYEAVLCELPIIVAKGTFLSEIVQEWGVGVSVNHKDSQELMEELKRLKNDKTYYYQFVKACKNKKQDLEAETHNLYKLKAIIGTR